MGVSTARAASLSDQEIAPTVLIEGTENNDVLNGTGQDDLILGRRRE